MRQSSVLLAGLRGKYNDLARARKRERERPNVKNRERFISPFASFTSALRLQNKQQFREPVKLVSLN